MIIVKHLAQGNNEAWMGVELITLRSWPRNNYTCFFGNITCYTAAYCSRAFNRPSVVTMDMIGYCDVFGSSMT